MAAKAVRAKWPSELSLAPDPRLGPRRGVLLREDLTRMFPRTLPHKSREEGQSHQCS